MALTLLATVSNEIHARQLTDLLRQNGIATLRQVDSPATSGIHPGPFTRIHLLVDEQDLTRARELLEAFPAEPFLPAGENRAKRAYRLICRVSLLLTVIWILWQLYDVFSNLFARR